MQTLHEFMLVTKGHEYLIAIAFLLIFILFWQFLFKTRAVPEVAGAFSMESFRLPKDIGFHPGHAWALIQPGGSIKVGIDDFIRRLVGPIDAITAPGPGTQAEEGTPLLSMRIGERELAVPSPLTGKVVSVNADLMRGMAAETDSELDQEWLIEIQPDNPRVAAKGLRAADQAARWLEGEMERLRGFLSAQVVRPALAGVTLADGGEPIRGALALLDKEGWAAFQQKFLASKERAN